MGKIPIAHKYCEGKVKRTLKKELKEHEIVQDLKSVGTQRLTELQFDVALFQWFIKELSD